MNCEELGIKTHITPEFVRQEIAEGRAVPVSYTHLCLHSTGNGTKTEPLGKAAKVSER